MCGGGANANMAIITKKNIFKVSKTRIVIGVFVVAILLVKVTTVICYHSYNSTIQTEFQYEIYAKLNGAQHRIEDVISSNDRDRVKLLALHYEQLGTTFANLSSRLFENSYYGTGGWGEIAVILSGIHNDFDLFKQYDGPLSVEEIEFLEQLSDVNDVLLADLADSVSSNEIKIMSITSLQEILNTYHIVTLPDFLADW